MIGRRKFVPPVQAVDGGWRLNLGDDERAMLLRLLGELRQLLTSGDDTTHPLLQRLFPPAFLDDPDKEAEYQRLMREELVASRLAAVQMVSDVLRSPSDTTLDESTTMSFMQSVNALRLVLGTMLGITDDESADAADVDPSPEHDLYDYLSWLLEWTVRSLSGA